MRSLITLTDGRGVDVVFDPVGGEQGTQCARAMGWEGRLLVIGFAAGDVPKIPSNLILVKNFSVVGVVFGAHSLKYPKDSRARWEGLFEHVLSGKLRPRVWKTFPLRQARAALTEITQRTVKGKVILTI
jgi:NADPH2:quinone reductase